MKSALVFVTVLISVLYHRECNAIYLTNTSHVKRSNNPAIWTEEGIWGPVMEEWALRSETVRYVPIFVDSKKIFYFQLSSKLYFRQSRVMQIPISEQTYIIEERKDTTPKESKISIPGKIVSNQRPSAVSSKPPPRQVSETDLYLLGAIEKLVYKVDFMEKRLRRVEEMLYYVMAGNRVDVGKILTKNCKIEQNG